MPKVIRGGHNNQSQGASARVNEVTEDRKICASTLRWLTIAGEKVIDGTPGNMDERSDLRYGTNIADANNADLFASIHLNKCYENFEGEIGSEIWLNLLNPKSVAIGNRILANLARLGFENRGLKDGVAEEYHDVVAPRCSSMIIECFFCESEGDVANYMNAGYDAVGKAIAEGIVGHSISGSYTPSLSRGVVSLFQYAVNVSGLTDENGNRLVEDNLAGVGGHTRWVINNKLYLHTGSTGELVKWLQHRLIDLGYSCGSYGADGSFGNATLAALKLYQAARGLTVDGQCGPNTVVSLLGL